MKVAFCLSGQPRFVEQSVRSIIANVIPYNDCDFFVHTWFNPDKEVVYDSAQPTQDGNVGRQQNNTLEILSELNPTLKYEKQIDFTSHVDGLAGFQTNRMFQMASMFYTAKQAHELCKQSNCKYDVIVRSRMDLIYQSPFVVNITDFSKMYSAEKWQCVRTKDYSVCDSFMLASMDKMDVLTNAYDRIRELHPLINPPTSEHFIGYILKEHGISTVSYPADVEIAHRLFRNV